MGTSSQSHSGIEVPTTMKRALDIDQETKTDYWEKAITKEMLHV
jgi:hypothetical protein